MANVSWNARDELGRMIEVTSDTVMDVAPPGPEQIAGGGGEQRIRLLGPYTVNYDTDDIEDSNTGLTLFSVTTTDIILDCWVRIITDWNSDDSCLLDIATRSNFDSLIPGGVELSSHTVSHKEDAFSDLGRRVSGVADFAAQASSAQSVLSADGDTFTYRPRVVPAHVKVAGEIFAYITRSGSAPSAGQALIYALIAQPA